MITTLVFDVNETMLDLAALDPHFDRIFGDAAVRRTWFSLVLRNALTLTVLGDYRDFTAVAGASLEMVSSQRSVELTPEDRSAVAATMRSLPAHDDVPRSLERLNAAGFRLVTLTNSPPDVAADQLRNAGLAPFLSDQLSVHSTGRLKPHEAVYRDAAAAIGVPLEEMIMVAAHDWDIAGAMATGMHGAYVMRPGTARNPLFPPPTLAAPTMDEVATAILADAAS